MAILQLPSGCVLFVCTNPDAVYFLKSKSVRSASLGKSKLIFYRKTLNLPKNVYITWSVTIAVQSLYVGISF